MLITCVHVCGFSVCCNCDIVIGRRNHLQNSNLQNSDLYTKYCLHEKLLYINVG